MSEVQEKRRALLDAIYAIHAGDGQILIALPLAQAVARGWDEYDEALLREAESKWNNLATLAAERTDEVERLDAALKDLGDWSRQEIAELRGALVTARDKADAERWAKQTIATDYERQTQTIREQNAEIERLKAERDDAVAHANRLRTIIDEIAAENDE